MGAPIGLWLWTEKPDLESDQVGTGSGQKTMCLRLLRNSTSIYPSLQMIPVPIRLGLVAVIFTTPYEDHNLLVETFQWNVFFD